jgi:hypothetical protein
MQIRYLTVALLALALGGFAYASGGLSYPGKNADFTVTDSAVKITGWSVRESAAGAAVATVILRNGADTDTGTGGVQCAASGGVAQVGGEPLIFIELAPDESVGEEYYDGLSAPLGLCADIVAGTVDLTVYVK